MNKLSQLRIVVFSICLVLVAGMLISFTDSYIYGQDDSQKVTVPLEGAELIRTDSSIDKVVTGKTDKINVKVNSTKEIIVFGLKEGATTLHVWTKDGVEQYLIVVAETAEQGLGDKLRQILVGDNQQEEGVEMRVFTPEYREVTEFEKYINELLKDEGEVLLADQPSGKLFVVGDKKLLDKVQQLLDRLDVPTEKKVYTKRIVFEHRPVTQVIENIRKLLTTTAEASDNPNITQGKAIVDRETNSILLVDTVEKVNSIQNYVDQIDVQTVQQVRIKARFVELSDDISNVKSLNWRVLDPDQSVDVNFNPDLLGGATLQPNASGLSIDNIGLTSGDFTGFVRFLQENDLADLISSPNVVTRNQQKAQLTIQNQISYVSDCQVTLSEGGQTVTAVTETLKDGITLNVTPSIGKNDVVQLEIVPELRIADLGQSTQVSNQCAFFTPEVDVRRATLRVALKDGQTLIIGGLTRQEDSVQESNVPYLNEIPVMGSLFSNSEVRSQKKNIAIFITANIIDFEDIGAPDTGPIDINRTKFPKDKQPTKLEDESGLSRPITNP